VCDSYITVGKSAISEFAEKKSKFIGYVKPVSTEDDALSFINEIKSRHWDARHNVFAYVVRENNIARYSDDGEPHGTAGVPILDIIKRNNLQNVVVVVTRYFGGILLGTGGLREGAGQLGPGVGVLGLHGEPHADEDHAATLPPGLNG